MLNDFHCLRFAKSRYSWNLKVNGTILVKVIEIPPCGGENECFYCMNNDHDRTWCYSSMVWRITLFVTNINVIHGDWSIVSICTCGYSAQNTTNAKKILLDTSCQHRFYVAWFHIGIMIQLNVYYDTLFTDSPIRKWPFPRCHYELHVNSGVKSKTLSWSRDHVVHAPCQ